MKKIVIAILVLTFLFVQRVHSQDARPFAVVELFTSEGCSSCPPADKLLRELTQKGRETNRRIYTMSFHVDYWNYIGWEDRFSKPEFTSRQKKYSQVMGTESVYTPQMIINGKTQFTGNRRDLAMEAINQALSVKPQLDLKIEIKLETKDQIEMEYFVSNLPKSALINFAFVEDDLSSQVNAGENYGSTLTHSNVVYALKSISLSQPQGNISLQKPHSFEGHPNALIAFIQDSKTMEILGADMLALNKKQ